MIDNRIERNLAILDKLETLTLKTVDYYLNKDNDQMFVSLKSKEDLNSTTTIVRNLLANELQAKFKLI